MSDLLAAIPVTALVPDGHYGPAGAAGVTARRLDDLAAATVVARKGAAGRLAEAFAAAGLPLPAGPRAATAGGVTLVATGPGRWTAFAAGTPGADLRKRLSGAGAGLCAVTDQSDANLVYEISGAQVRETLAKGVTLDLHERTFGPGDAATTLVAMVGVTFWQTDAAPVYRFAVARSFAPAFLRWLTASAAPFGFGLSSGGRG